jgi:hypothetical protein
MDQPKTPKIDLENLNPEVRAYIYQTVSEFEPFITPTTMISVIAKDLPHSINQFSSRQDRPWRIAISLTEEGTTLQEEASDHNIYHAICKAKEKLLKTLEEIQDSVISNQDRTAMINNIRDSGTLH